MSIYSGILFAKEDAHETCLKLEQPVKRRSAKFVKLITHSKESFAVASIVVSILRLEQDEPHPPGVNEPLNKLIDDKTAVRLPSEPEFGEPPSVEELEEQFHVLYWDKHTNQLNSLCEKVSEGDQISCNATIGLWSEYSSFGITRGTWKLRTRTKIRLLGVLIDQGGSYFLSIRKPPTRNDTPLRTPRQNTIPSSSKIPNSFFATSSLPRAYPSAEPVGIGSVAVTRLIGGHTPEQP
ncbi:MAG: hypothetical protein MMC33_006638 [Icmadophila ericetorum]|nr:hypothetical protein [Icmadophila ericetorum]